MRISPVFGAKSVRVQRQSTPIQTRFDRSADLDLPLSFIGVGRLMVVELGGFEPESDRGTVRPAGVSVRIRCELRGCRVRVCRGRIRPCIRPSPPPQNDPASSANTSVSGWLVVRRSGACMARWCTPCLSPGARTGPGKQKPPPAEARGGERQASLIEETTGGYLLTPLTFSTLRKPPMPNRPVMTTQSRSRLSSGGGGQPLTAATQASRGWRIVA